MKSSPLKTLLAVATAGIATFAFAMDSGNVIGYQGKQISKGRHVFTMPFTNNPGNGSLAQSLGTLLPSACEGDIIEFNDFKAEATVVGGTLHWYSNGTIVDDCILPSNGQPITYTRKADTTTELSFSGEVHEAALVKPLTEKPTTPIEVKGVSAKPRFFLADILSYSTIRIECVMTNYCSTGTGFFYFFSIGQGRSIPAIITNRHVVDGSVLTVLTFSMKKDGAPLHEKIRLKVPTNICMWYGHHDTNVDLSYMPILPIIEHLKRQGKEVFFIPYAKDFIPTADELTGITQLDDVAMIGYPNGIWDEVNNQPIFRKGVLATRPNKNYKGKHEFVIDMPVYGGSSGSPVLLINETPYFDRTTRKLDYHSRIKLLGVNYATYLHSATGAVEAVPIATLNTQSTNYMAKVPIPNNLGLVINASRILEIEESLRRIFTPTAK